MQTVSLASPLLAYVRQQISLASPLLAYVRQQVVVEPLSGELQVVPLGGQEHQLARPVHGGQAQAVLRRTKSGSNGSFTCTQLTLSQLLTLADIKRRLGTFKNQGNETRLRDTAH